MKTRLLKINAEIQKTLGQIILYELNNPKLNDSIVSVTKVNTASDLSRSVVHISILDKENQQEIFDEIKHSGTYIRKLLSQKIRLRKTPMLEFKLDNTAENAQKIDEMLDVITKARGVDNDNN